MIKLLVNEKEIEAEEGKNLLEVCLESGIYVPNLCFLIGMSDPPTSCRLCFVEVEGETRPVTSCNVEPREGMVVRTNTATVRRLQATALRLLLTVHKADCKNCPSNRKCELQRMVRFLGVRLKPRRFEHLDRQTMPDPDQPFLEFVHSRCVLCGKCIYVCQKRNGYSLLTFAKRGFDTVISSFGGNGPESLPCGTCRGCIEICPVSAILPRGPCEKIVPTQ